MKIERKHIVWLVAFVAVLSLFPFLGLNEFHTKGEPREAVVSLSMLLQDNFILPENNGGDIPYKPPFLHWCIAAISYLLGTLNEYISRVPSAISLVLLSVATYLFYKKRSGEWTAVLTAMVGITCFELHRAGGNCRVDMVLSSAMAIGSFLLYRWWEKDNMKGLPWLSLVALSMATLTKGPVGVCLPLFVFGVFLLIRKEKFLRIVIKLFPVFLCSLVAPALWYWAAYQQGGLPFLDLIYEENVGRLTGTMTYSSHEGPAIINFVYLVSGFVPWTILLVVSLFFKPWQYCKSESKPNSWKERLANWWSKMESMSDYRLFTLLNAVLIIGFFCIPKSKRSVYLMPAFPFIAYFIAEYILWIEDRIKKANDIYRNILIGVVVLLFVAHLVFAFDLVHVSKPATQAMFSALADLNLFTVICVFGIAFGVIWWVCRHYDNRIALPALGFVLFAILDAFTLPTILNTKSVKWYAEEINKVVPEGDIYSFLKTDIKPNANMMHQFELDYYLNDRVKLFLKEKPESGKLIVLEKELEEYRDSIFADYEMNELLRTDRNYGTFHDIILLMDIVKKK